jgi:hypothetical protein
MYIICSFYVYVKHKMRALLLGNDENQRISSSYETVSYIKYLKLGAQSRPMADVYAALLVLSLSFSADGEAAQVGRSRTKFTVGTLSKLFIFRRLKKGERAIIPKLWRIVGTSTAPRPCRALNLAIIMGRPFWAARLRLADSSDGV